MVIAARPCAQDKKDSHQVRELVDAQSVSDVATVRQRVVSGDQIQARLPSGASAQHSQEQN